MSTKDTDNSRFEIEIHAVLGRVAKLTRVNTDAALAEALGTSRQVLSGWKKRGTIPFDRLCELAIERDLSLDYILIGKKHEVVSQGIKKGIFNEVWSALRSEDCQLHQLSGDLLLEQAILIYNQVVQITEPSLREQAIDGSISLLNSMSYYIQAQDVRDTAQKKPETFNPDEAERFAKQLERSAEDEKQALETRVLQGQSTHQTIEGRGHQVAGRDFQNHGNNDGRGGKK